METAQLVAACRRWLLDKNSEAGSKQAWCRTGDMQPHRVFAAEPNYKGTGSKHNSGWRRTPETKVAEAGVRHETEHTKITHVKQT